MDAVQLMQSLKKRYWSTVTLANILGCPTVVVMGCYYGNAPVPQAVGEWLARLAEAHDSNPPTLDQQDQP